jgi:uncharacterized protein (DUF4415 family)
MPRKKSATASTWTDPDDAPELTDDWFEKAHIYDGDRLVKRGRGRPPLTAPKQQITLRLDATLIEKLRASGKGWSGRVNAILRRSMDRGEFADMPRKRKAG